MIWDFAESNPFCNATSNWLDQVEWVAKVLELLPLPATAGSVYQSDAATNPHDQGGLIIATDPPYYDNISYAELSDFFYVWLRPMLREIYPDLFAGILVPIQEEMIAAPRFDNANTRFESLLKQTLKHIRERCSEAFPSSIVYGYKQQEQEREGTTSTGWDTMLTALVSVGFQIIGTWPMRTELANRPNSLGANALASSVILVVRPRPEDAPVATRRQFIDELYSDLPKALDHLTREAHIAPVDLAQAAIGPGMEIYSRYARVETLAGEPVTVRDALMEINRVIARYDEREQGDFDLQTRFCLDWLRAHEYREGIYGQAELLSRAKNVDIQALADQGLLQADGGQVRLRQRGEYDHSQPRLQEMTAWEGLQRIAWHLSDEQGGGETGAAAIVRAMGGDADAIERLARILYNHYDRARDSANAVLYNGIVTSWQQIRSEADRGSEQGELL